MNNQLHNIVNDGYCFSNDFSHNVLFSNFLKTKIQQSVFPSY